MSTNVASESLSAAPQVLGGVELREDVPLKQSAGGSRANGAACCTGVGGPRLIPAAFAALTACITLALLTQIYAGDYELVPHGSVSSSAAQCSRAGTDALKAGGRALDAAAAAALCLAVVAPHRTSLDASGSLLYWEYRESRTQQPMLYEWGPAGAETAAEVVETGDVEATGPDRAPRLVAALAYLHAQLGTLPWKRILAPAIQIASEGFPVSEGLLAASATTAVPLNDLQIVGANATAPEIARYLRLLQFNTSAELSAAWNSQLLVRRVLPMRVSAGTWRIIAGGAGTSPALRALQSGLEPTPATLEDAQMRVIAALQREARATAAGGASDAGATSPYGVATGLAAVDRRDTYVALVTGVSVPFGSGPESPMGWRRDEPTAPLDLAPAVLLEPHVCGSRYVLGAESAAALAQAAAALATVGTMSAVESARVGVLTGGMLALEVAREPPPPPLPPTLPPLPVRNATLPYAAVNLVLQRGDALSSHADSRGGGLASRF